MARRSKLTTPTVGKAGGDLASALGDLVQAAGRWLGEQPAAAQAPVYAERLRQASAESLDQAGAWAEQTAGAARDQSVRAASATRTGIVNLALVGLVLWWVDRMLVAGEDL